MEHSLLQGKFAPSEDDVIQYKRFVTAAVLSHVELGCNVTPKVHMMWSHVVDGMRLPGGLGQNREDLVEHHHQITSRERVQFGKTNDPVVQVHAMDRLHQQHMDPEVVLHDIAVNKAARRGSRKGYVSRDQHRHEQRMMNRWTALSAFENTNLVTDLVGVDGVMACR